MINLNFIDWPWALSLVVVLPVIITLLIVRGRRRRVARLSRLGTTDMIARLAPNVIGNSRWHIVRAIIYSALFGMAFAGPRWGVTQNVVAQKGVDIVLALDASQSMLANDERPSRLAAMKEAVYALRELSPSDRFAIVAFAGRSYILTPMTVDDAALNLFLDNLDPTTVGQGGSSLSSAIRQATNLLAIGQSQSGKAIVLMSDGEGFEDDQEIVTEAKRAAGMGIRVITVGFGTTSGSQIPIRENGVVTAKKDEGGATVVTRYSPVMLQDAAKNGGGTFIPAGDPDRARHIRRALVGLRAGAGPAQGGADLAPRFQWFLLPAVLLLILDTIRSAMLARKRKESVVGTTSVAAAILFFASTSCARDPDKALYPLYDRGTVLVKADSMRPAQPLLEKATGAKNAELRFRARFNLGYAQLVRGLRYTKVKNDSAEAVLDSTLAVYRADLEERPTSLDAKWNYELALRANSGGGGGGGGGGAPQPQPSPNKSDADMPAPKAVGSMGVNRAEQLLNSIADQEQDVQGRKQRKNVPQDPPRGKDW